MFRGLFGLKKIIHPGLVVSNIFGIFTPKLGEDSHFDYFSNGFKPPTRFSSLTSKEKTCMKFSRISGRGLVMTKEAGVFMSRKGGIFCGGMRLIEHTRENKPDKHYF